MIKSLRCYHININFFQCHFELRAKRKTIRIYLWHRYRNIKPNLKILMVNICWYLKKVHSLNKIELLLFMPRYLKLMRLNIRMQCLNIKNTRFASPLRFQSAFPEAGKRALKPLSACANNKIIKQISKAALARFILLPNKISPVRVPLEGNIPTWIPYQILKSSCLLIRLFSLQSETGESMMPRTAEN